MHQLPDDEKPVYANLKETLDVFEIGMNRAMELITEKRNNPGRGRSAAAKPLRELGEHPDAGGPVNVMEGRYGAYVKWDKVNATIPKEVDVANVTMEQAVEWIAAKKPTKKKAAPKKKPAAKRRQAQEKPAAKKQRKNLRQRNRRRISNNSRKSRGDRQGRSPFHVDINCM